MFHRAAAVLVITAAGALGPATSVGHPAEFDWKRFQGQRGSGEVAPDTFLPALSNCVAMKRIRTSVDC